MNSVPHIVTSKDFAQDRPVSHEFLGWPVFCLPNADDQSLSAGFPEGAVVFVGGRVCRAEALRDTFQTQPRAVYMENATPTPIVVIGSGFIVGDRVTVSCSVGTGTAVFGEADPHGQEFLIAADDVLKLSSTNGELNIIECVLQSGAGSVLDPYVWIVSQVSYPVAP